MWPLLGKLKLPDNTDWDSTTSISENPTGMPNIMPWTVAIQNVLCAVILVKHTRIDSLHKKNDYFKT
jgi:hypothetical protein